MNLTRTISLNCFDKLAKNIAQFRQQLWPAILAMRKAEGDRPLLTAKIKGDRLKLMTNHQPESEYQQLLLNK
ncbi:hypothetical protein [Microcoleus sp. LAD1_D1]|uniref:hypothetical protein n=1 Tax=Microcoleus sp. LAD1_D1 TaxID=2818812 RepID=UPI002FD794D2